MTFEPTSIEVTCATLPKDHCVQIHWKYIKVYGYNDPFSKTLTNGQSMTPRWPLIPLLLKSHVWLPNDHCVQLPWKYIKECGYSDQFLKLLTKRSMTPRWHLTPLLLRSHVWLYQSIIMSKSHGNTSKYVDAVTIFQKKTSIKRSMTQTIPRWPLTPHPLRSHVWLYPRITVSNPHKNMSKHVDTVTFFQKI